MWKRALDTGAQHLWRIKRDRRLDREHVLDDGSYLSTIYPSKADRRRKTKNIRVRVIEYELAGVADAEPLYRIVTSILDPQDAPAEELAILYHERWEVETGFDEIKTHLRGPGRVLRSRSPDSIIQEFYALMLSHFATRHMMHEAALAGDIAPNRLSFTRVVNIIRRKLPRAMATPRADLPKLQDEIIQEILNRPLDPRRNRRYRRCVKRKMSSYALNQRNTLKLEPFNIRDVTRVRRPDAVLDG
jgi:hypothetical protein